MVYRHSAPSLPAPHPVLTAQRQLLATWGEKLVGELGPADPPAGTLHEAFNLSRPWFLRGGWRGFEPL